MTYSTAPSKKKLLKNFILLSLFLGLSSACTGPASIEITPNAELWLRKQLKLHGTWEPNLFLVCSTGDFSPLKPSDFPAVSAPSRHFRIQKRGGLSLLATASTPGETGPDRWADLYRLFLSPVGQTQASDLVSQDPPYPSTPDGGKAWALAATQAPSSANPKQAALLTFQVQIDPQSTQLFSLHQAKRDAAKSWISTSDPDQITTLLLERWSASELKTKLDSGFLSPELDLDPAYPGTYRFLQLRGSSFCKITTGDTGDVLFILLEKQD